MEGNSRNKEVVENKFLIERLLRKLLDSGKITQKEIPDLKWKFRKELLRHESKPPKARLEILVDLFKKQQVQKPAEPVLQRQEESSHQSSTSVFANKKNNSSQSVPPQPQGSFAADTLEQAVGILEKNIEDKSKNDVLPEQSVTVGAAESDHKDATQTQSSPAKDTVSKDIVSVLETVLSEKKELPPRLYDEALNYLLAEARYLNGVSVNNSVIKKLTERSLGRFMSERVQPPTTLSRSQEDTSLTEQENKKTNPNPILQQAEEMRDDQVVQPEPVIKKTVFSQPDKGISPLGMDTSAASYALQSLDQTTEPQSAQQVQSESNQQSQHTRVETAPTNNVQPQVSQSNSREAQHADKSTQDVFKVNVTSEISENQPQQNGRSLAEIILAQAREADRNNPLVSHQEAIEKPPRPFGSKRKEPTEEEVSSAKITVEKSHDSSVSKPPQAPALAQQVTDLSPEDLAQASNTKISFDRDVELDPSQIEQRHTVRNQQNTLFDKYLNEQVETLMEVASLQGANDPTWLEETRSSVEREAHELIDGSDSSISEKIHQLDIYFDKKRREIAEHQPTENKKTVEQLVDTVLAKAGQEVRTDDSEADARFRDTLRDTLHFKAKHLLGIDMDIPQIQAALNEEFSKHKAFYLKSVK